jgi:succinate-semialdehyde dehydrogenase/glutarate-semialdehyde dehydrogenase
MTTRRQIETVQRLIEDALSKGATIHARSSPVQTEKFVSSMPAVVLTNVHHGMRIMREETFGPVICVMKVKNMEEAVVMANDSDLGLSGSVWSRNRKKAENLARKIEAGVLMINDHLMNHGMPETTMSGCKLSGMGASHGAIGFDEMTRPQVIVDELLPFIKNNMWWHPHGKQIYRGLTGAIDLLYAKQMPVRIHGLLRLMKIIPRYVSTRR